MKHSLGLSGRFFRLLSVGRRSRDGAIFEPLESRSYFSAISFAPHVDQADGTKPAAICAADFNHDGKLDVATADGSTGKVNLFLGNGVGGFSAGSALTLLGNPLSMFSGDFNGDGLPDIAVACTTFNPGGSTGVTIFLNSAAAPGSFASGQITTIRTGLGAGEPIAIVAGDFNADSHLDIATADFTAGTVSVLLGTGIGTFATPTPYTVGSNPTAITTGDFNGDDHLDLAVTDTRSAAKVVTLLTGTGSGTFSAGADISLSSAGGSAITAADLNHDGIPDLVVGNTDRTVTVLGNNGNAQFVNSASISIAGAATDVAVADFNFDGTPDVLSANGGAGASANSVTIATGSGVGTFPVINDFATGAQPAQAAVGDFNGDSKPDIVVANAGAGTFSILLNNTAGTVTRPTSTTLVAASPSAPFATNVHLTATVSVPAGSANPTGSVQFLDGNKVIGAGIIATGTNIAVLDIASLGVGTHKIKAVYQGDSVFATSTSAVAIETITPTPGNGPDLSVAFVSTTLPPAFVYGEKGIVKFRITNVGNSLAKGSITNTLFLSLDGTFDPSDIPLTITGSLAQASINLAPTQGVTLSGSFTIPAGFGLADYHLVANINVKGTLLESDATQESNNTAASPGVLSAVTQFGTVGGRRNVILTLPDADGTLVTYKLTGPGTGTFSNSDSGIHLSLTGTTLGSTLTLSGAGGNGFVDLNSLNADAAIGNVKGPSANFTGGISLSGSARSVILNNVSQPAPITLGAGASPRMTFGVLTGITISSASGIASLSVASIINGEAGASVPPSGTMPLFVELVPSSINTPWIGTFLCRGNCSTEMSLSGTGSPGGAAIRSATIGGSVLSLSNQWSIGGDVNRLSIKGSVESGPTANITGKVRSLMVGGNFGGRLAAAGGFGTVLIQGNLSGAILAGANFGANGVLGGGDDTFAAAGINSLRVGSSTAGALVAAGLDPIDGILSNGNDTLLPGGVIKSIVITGAADPASKFLAAALPKKARVGGAAVVTATDPRFQV